jgi:GH25 family lysozyme M1 (1,4-beta-N-acetylmuramidase)
VGLFLWNYLDVTFICVHLRHELRNTNNKSVTNGIVVVGYIKTTTMKPMIDPNTKKPFRSQKELEIWLDLKHFIRTGTSRRPEVINRWKNRRIAA